MAVVLIPNNANRHSTYCLVYSSLSNTIPHKIVGIYCYMLKLNIFAKFNLQQNIEIKNKFVECPKKRLREWTQYQNITLRKGRTIAIIHVAFLHFLRLLQELLIFFFSIMSPAHYFSIFTIANLGQFYTDMANNAVLL